MLKVAPSRLLYNVSSSVCDDASGGSPATTADSAEREREREKEAHINSPYILILP